MSEKETKANVPFPEVEADDEKFESDYEFYLSQSEFMRQYEIQFKQTIQINPDEQKNPNVINNYLDKMDKSFGIKLSSGTATDFFSPTTSNGYTFEQNLEMRFGQDFFRKAILRIYQYLVLLNRKSMNYHFDSINRDYSFDLRDVYSCGHIDLQCFNAVNDIPSNIVKRMKIGREVYQLRAKHFERQLIKLEKQLEYKTSQLQNAFSNDSEDQSTKEAKAKSLESEIKSVKFKIEKLSFDIEEELSKTPRSESPTPDDIIDFIAHFVRYGIHVTSDVIENPKMHEVEFINDTSITKSFPIIRRIHNEDLYFQNTISHVWVHAEHIITRFISQLAPTVRLSRDQVNDLFDGLIQAIQKMGYVNIFSFKKDCLFFENGVIVMDYQDDGSIQYHFKSNDDMTLNESMFSYATNMRLNMSYSDDIPTVFDDNDDQVPVTPDFIFGDLGRRGYEITDDTAESDIEKLKSESQARANLLMQETLKVLMPFNDLTVLKDTFLYFFNSANSGKSTYMKLMNEMVGHQSTANLETKDFSSKESFGLVNVKDKRLVLIDEATDGKSKIDTENIKKISAKERINTNVKNRDYVAFQPTAEMIFASNYEPMFSDESGGTERRLLAFQLATGYSYQADDDKKKDLTFIKQDLVSRNAFKVACVKWVLNNVNVNQAIPTSIQEDATSLISQEDDVQSFIKDKVQPLIESPLFINVDHLYDLYKIEMISKGRQVSKIRNKTNFKKALLKMRTGVYQVREVSYSKVDVMNRVIALQGQLFHDANQTLNDNTFNNAVIKSFMENMNTRNQYVRQFYDDVKQVKNKTLSLSLVSRAKKVMFIILPDTPTYEGVFDDKTLRDVSNNQKNAFLRQVLTDRNLELIYNDANGALPTPINSEMENRFHNYTNDAIADRTPFTDFIKYKY